MSSLLFYMMILYHMQFFYALLLVLFRWRCRSTANSASIYFPTTAENPTTEALFYCINSHLYVVPINRSDYIRRLDVIHFSQHYNAISIAMLNILWDLSAMVVNVLIALLKFPFHFVANLPSYCDSVSNFFHHLFWFVIYAVIVVLVVWYCVHTVLITIERKEWKMKRKMKKKQ